MLPGSQSSAGFGPELLSLLQGSGRIGLYTRDLASGQAQWDAGLYAMTGLDPQAAAPDWSQFLQHVHGDDRAALDAHFANLARQPLAGEVHFRFCRPDGDVRLMHTIFDVQADDQGRPSRIVGVMIDDSGVGQRLQQGERSRQFLERALSMAGVSVWTIDLGARRVHFNAVGFQVVGMTPDPAGIPLDELRDSIHPQDRAAILAAADAAIDRGGMVDAVARYRTADGGWKTLLTRRLAVRDRNGVATGLMGVSLDLTGEDAERARAEALTAQTRLVAQAMGVGFWQRDQADEAVVWDAQMYRLYGRDPSRLPPTLDEWLDSYVQLGARAEARRQLEVDRAAWSPETLMTVPVRGDDGQERWVRAWTRRGTQDGRRFAMGMHLDVTEQVRHDAARQEAERSARESREKSAFMAMMSHRLRTPLNAVLGFAQLMAQDSAEPLSARQRERLARIDAAGAELLSMIDDVFELAALDTGTDAAQTVAVPLTQVLLGLRESVEPLARLRGVGLRLPADPPTVQVATDRRLLGQALRHLVAHALRRSERGGHVEVTANVCAPWLRLVFSDAGPRLDAAQRELLFDAVSQPAPPVTDGDALVGLNLVRQALARLGAGVDWLHPDPSDSRLVVTLPLVDVAESPVPVAPLRLLCIEDNPVNLMLVQELVAMRPAFRFLSATDGLSGLALAARDRPDVVLLDLHLPDLHGTEVAARLRADPATAGCHLVALSAGALPEDIRAAKAQGFDDYWTKPIDFDHFLAGLDRLAARQLRAPDAP